MKGTIIHTDGSEVPIEFDGEPTLKEMQDIVGGMIEFVSVRNECGDPTHMIVNEEGLLIGLHFNYKATEHYHRAVVVPNCEKAGKPYYMQEHSPIVGPALLLEIMMA